MIQLNIPEIVAGVIVFLFGSIAFMLIKHWYQKENERKEEWNLSVRRNMAKTDAVVYAAIQVLNGKGEEFKTAMEGEYKKLCTERNLKLQ